MMEHINLKSDLKELSIILMLIVVASLLKGEFFMLELLIIWLAVKVFWDYNQKLIGILLAIPYFHIFSGFGLFGAVLFTMIITSPFWIKEVLDIII